MNTGKACGPDQIPIEVWTLLGDEGLEYLLQTMNAVIDEGMPLSWRKSEISPLFKGKGSVLECGNYRGIKLMAHTMKLWERIIDRRIREIVELDDIQFGFRKGRSTTEPIQSCLSTTRPVITLIGCNAVGRASRFFGR